VSSGTLLAILAMAAVTYPMRAGGYWLMGRITLTPRVRRLLEALPGSVVVATVLPILVREGSVAAIAMAAALGVGVIARNEFLILVAGVGAAALARAAGL
jgi:uncharacterized membrane protein